MENINERISFQEYQDNLKKLERKKDKLRYFELRKKLILTGKIIKTKRDLEIVYMNSSEMYSLVYSYQELLDRFFQLTITLGFKSSIEIFALYNFLIKNGYLSVTHHFMYTKDIKDCFPFLGINVVEGEGVCRHIASMLTDFFKRQGFISANISMVFQNLSDFVIDNQEFDEKEPEEKQRKEPKKKSIFNHLVTLVKDRDGTLLLDPTCGLIFYVWNNQIISPLFHQEFVMKCQYEDFFNLNVSQNLSQLLTTTNEEMLLHINRIYHDTMKKIMENIPLLDAFYQNNF